MERKRTYGVWAVRSSTSISDRHKAGARKMENRWSLIAKPTLKTMQRKPTSIRQQMSDTM